MLRWQASLVVHARSSRRVFFFFFCCCGRCLCCRMLFSSASNVSTPPHAESGALISCSLCVLYRALCLSGFDASQHVEGAWETQACQSCDWQRDSMVPTKGSNASSATEQWETMTQTPIVLLCFFLTCMVCGSSDVWNRQLQTQAWRVHGRTVTAHETTWFPPKSPIPPLPESSEKPAKNTGTACVSVCCLSVCVVVCMKQSLELRKSMHARWQASVVAHSTASKRKWEQTWENGDV